MIDKRLERIEEIAVSCPWAIGPVQTEDKQELVVFRMLHPRHGVVAWTFSEESIGAMLAWCAEHKAKKETKQ